MANLPGIYYGNVVFFMGIFYVCFGLDPLNINLCSNMVSPEIQLDLSLRCASVPVLNSICDRQITLEPILQAKHGKMRGHVVSQWW